MGRASRFPESGGREHPVRGHLALGGREAAPDEHRALRELDGPPLEAIRRDDGERHGGHALPHILGAGVQDRALAPREQRSPELWVADVRVLPSTRPLTVGGTEGA